MTFHRLAAMLAGATLACSCFQDHPAGAIQTPGGDQSECVACHLGDYHGTTSPPHDGQFPTTCGDCHGTHAWQPALSGSHPESAFPIRSGDHQGTRCLECHRPELGPSTDGANTDCIACHTRPETDPEHQGVGGYQFQPAVRNFCLTCHPSGEASEHPESRFPISGGPHGQIACASCHVYPDASPVGGLDTTCTGCHTGVHSRAEMDDKHTEVGGYQWSDTNPRFCRTCHPNGQED